MELFANSILKTDELQYKGINENTAAGKKNIAGVLERINTGDRIWSRIKGFVERFIEGMAV